jgi:RimJ/RimL family protein N-acetyltransferase
MPIDIQPPSGLHLLELRGYEDVYKLWDRFRNVPAIFDDFTRADIDRFTRLLTNPATLWLETDDGNGILYLTDIMPGLSAYAHFVFWDRKLRGREALIISTLKWAFITLNLIKINAWIPDFAKAAIHFAEKLGFMHEGVLRRWSFSQGKPYDKVALGITREEALNGTGLLLPKREGTASGMVSRREGQLESELQQSVWGIEATGPDDSSDLQPDDDAGAESLDAVPASAE